MGSRTRRKRLRPVRMWEGGEEQTHHWGHAGGKGRTEIPISRDRGTHSPATMLVRLLVSMAAMASLGLPSLRTKAVMTWLRMKKGARRARCR